MRRVGAASYAVRVINIPIQHADAAVYARLYYVFTKDGEEIVVYGSYHLYDTTKKETPPTELTAWSAPNQTRDTL